MAETPTTDPIGRVHERLDDVLAQVSDIAASMKIIASRCENCQGELKKHTATLYGNGQQGLVSRMAAAETGRVDTLSVKAVCILLGAVGTLAGAIGAAIGAVVK